MEEEQKLYKQRFQATIDSLNESQKESVMSEAKTLQILAGPGSGKTRVLTCRVAHFILNKKLKPQQIIVVTFTNKAANEMKTRLYTIIGNKNTDNLVIGTFHSICSRFLRHNAAIVNLKSNFTVADTDVSHDIIKNLQKNETLQIDNYTRNRLKPGVIFSIISKAKSKGIMASEYQEMYANDFSNKHISVIYTAYEEELYKNNLVDFDNILLKACELFRKKKSMLAHIKAVLVDEYQDTNIVQYDLIKLITKNQYNDKSITIVGDPDQSIFSFRSAEPKNFYKMQDDYQDTEAINMEQNYRSTGIILEAALHVIKQDVTRIDKALYTNNPVGIPISLLTTEDENTQAEFVAKEIKKVLKYSKGLVDYKDFAVLMRMNSTSRHFESTFRKHRIPFTIVGGDRFFNRMEIKDVLGYFKFAYNNFDYHSYSRIVNVPKRGIGEVTLTKIAAFHETQEGRSMLETLHTIGRGGGDFSNTIRQKLKALAAICEDVKGMIEEKMEVTEILQFIVDATQYADYLKEKYFVDHEARLNNIGELISLAKEGTFLEDDELMTQTQPQQSQNDLNVVEVQVEDESENHGKSQANPMQYGDEDVPCFAADEDIPDFSMDEEIDLTNITERQKIESFHFTQEGGQSSSTPKKEKEEEYDFPVLEKDAIVEFLEYCSLSANQKEQDEAEGGRVTISTIHSSKGLEWPCVFIATCVDGVIPMLRDPDLSEEGRLLYVAMTRSQFFLYCITPEYRNNWGNPEATDRTHFLDNMNRKLYQSQSPDWDNDTRSMLAATLGKPAPPDDNELVTTKKKSSGFSTQYADSQSQGFSTQSHIPRHQSQPWPSSQHFTENHGGFVSASSLSELRPCKRAKSKQRDAQKVKKETTVKAEPVNFASSVVNKKEIKVKSEPLLDSL